MSRPSSSFPVSPSAPIAPGGPGAGAGSAQRPPAPAPTTTTTTTTTSTTSSSYPNPPPYSPHYDVKQAQPGAPLPPPPAYTSEQLDQEYTALVRLISNQQFRKFATNALKGAAYAAGGVVAGAVVAGPFGMMVGGVLGSIVGYCRSDRFDSLLKIMSRLPKQQQHQLVMDIISITGKQATLMTIQQIVPFHAQILSVLQLYTSAGGKLPFPTR